MRTRFALALAFVAAISAGAGMPAFETERRRMVDEQRVRLHERLGVRPENLG